MAANPKTPDLAGDWIFEAQTGENVAHGAMTLVAGGASYKGTLTTDQTDNILPVRSLTLQGSDTSTGRHLRCLAAGGRPMLA